MSTCCEAHARRQVLLKLTESSLRRRFRRKEHCRILIETELIYLFNVACLKITLFANYAVFSSLLFVNYFVVNTM